MNLQHINAKFYVDGPLNVDLQRFVEVFHRWVAGQTMHELLIDVADYRHVPAGPGVVLVGLQADYSIDQADHRPGLLYNRKGLLEGSNSERLGQAIASAVDACRLLEAEFSDLTFNYSQWDIIINDRVLAPNTPQTFGAFRPILGEFLANSLGQQRFNIQYDQRDPRRRFRVTVELAQSLQMATLESFAARR